MRLAVPRPLLGLSGGRPITEETFTGATHSTFEGRALAAIRAAGRPGLVTVTISADGCEPIEVTIPVIEADVTLDARAQPWSRPI
ncbi:hypothetical protein [Agromyces sp. Marseille-Q5079]|uniref:hypothetical protein n=1 Tax=Agromyces sp. Marseille-Q5079 TaxID=3439059 RepID=UPI003D9CA3D8